MCFLSVFSLLGQVQCRAGGDWQQENKELKEKGRAHMQRAHSPTHADTLPRIVMH